MYVQREPARFRMARAIVTGALAVVLPEFAAKALAQPAIQEPSKDAQTPRRRDADDGVNGGAKPRTFGSLTLALGRTAIQEGENVDATVSLRNGMTHPVLGLIPPGATNWALDLSVDVAQPGRNALHQEAGPADAHHRFHGTRFALAAGEARAFPLMLFDDAIQWDKSWLAPGSYVVRATYISPPSNGMVWIGQKAIDWKQPLVSNVVRLSVLPAPEEKRQNLDAARQFLWTDGRESAAFAAEYRRLLSTALAPSLKKRVRLHAALRMNAEVMRMRFPGPGGQERVDDEVRRREALVTKQFETLAAMELTPGESARILGLLGDRYVQAGRFREAKAVLEKIGTPRAQMLLKEVIQPKLEKAANPEGPKP